MSILIVVEGVGDSGKTSSIRDFAHTHLANLPIQKGREISHAGPFTKKSNHYTIGVRSAGDTRDLILAAIQLFTSNNCDLMVCATKSRGVTVNTINAYIAANPGLIVHRIQTQWFPTQAQQLSDNARVAQAIWNCIP